VRNGDLQDRREMLVPQGGTKLLGVGNVGVIGFREKT